jgi:hypothetical protein
MAVNADYFHVNPAGVLDIAQVMGVAHGMWNDVVDGLNQVHNTVVQWVGQSSNVAAEARQLASSVSNDLGMIAAALKQHHVNAAELWPATDAAAAARLAP